MDTNQILSEINNYFYNPLGKVDNSSKYDEIYEIVYSHEKEKVLEGLNLNKNCPQKTIPRRAPVQSQYPPLSDVFPRIYNRRSNNRSV